MIPAEEHLRAIRDELEQDQAMAAPAAFEAAALIQLDKVSLSFERPVLQDVSMVAREGETLMVVGESGSGKSTILKLILRLLVPDSGTIRVFGHDIGHMSFQEALEMRRQIGMVFQTAALFDSLTIYENVAYPLRENADLDEDEIERVVRERLDFVDLDPDQVMAQLPSQLSGGMRKRVGIARAIALRPKYILYDEPTTGLDPVTSAVIDELMVRMREKLGVTGIVITHDMRSAYTVGTRIAMLYEGRVRWEGTVEEIKHTSDPVVRQFIEGRAELDVEAAEGVA